MDLVVVSTTGIPLTGCLCLQVLRPGEHILAAARGDAEVCGLLSLDVGMKLSGRDERRNDMEVRTQAIPVSTGSLYLTD